MADAFKLATAIVGPALRLLLADQKQKRERSLPLGDLINVKVLDDYKRRQAKREIEAACDVIAKRLERLLEHEYGALSAAEKQAALDAVEAAFQNIDLSDEGIFSLDASPDRLANVLRSAEAMAKHRKWLSATESAFADHLLTESARLYTSLVVHLNSFISRGMVEILQRSTALSEHVKRLLERLPERSLDAPQGSDHDHEFKVRYLNHIAASLDEVELFGVDVRNYRPQATLSIAYISLAVTTNTKLLDNGLVADGREAKGVQEPATSATRVERALGHASRSLVRGEAGSGKSTLLRWIAISAARRSFTDELAEWNEKVPFLIKLRSFSGKSLPAPEQFLEFTAKTIAGLMPRGWVHRQLVAGDGLVLIDGVDELSVNERSAVRQWIQGLIHSFPDNRYVVTARPQAATAKWLVSEGFDCTFLERMSPDDIRALVRHWHIAIREGGNLPCDEEELPQYERSIVSQLEANSHLRSLATTPLLCTMLCALNLDRHMSLPPDRMGIYAAALELLLERRDVQRGIPSYAGINMDARGKLQILQYLAWRLSINGRAELDREQAIRQLTDRLRSLPMIEASPSAVLDHLLQRSGVIRQPSEDRIDFVHRTFQEYLTARETSEQGDVGFLIEKAHLDTWRETIIMAAGHANSPVRHSLLEGILNRASQELRHRRRLRLLAAACLETTGPLEVDLRERIEQAIADLIPPRQSEVRSLALAGRSLLRFVPRELSGLSEPSACALVNAVSLIGGPEAISILSEYANDARPRVLNSVTRAVQHFDPTEYAHQVLSKFLPRLPRLHLANSAELAACKVLEGVKKVDYVGLHDVTDLDTELRGAPSIRKLWVSGSIPRYSVFPEHVPDIQELIVWANGRIGDPSPLGSLSRLRKLCLARSRMATDRHLDTLDFLNNLPDLQMLWMYGLSKVEDYSPLLSLASLEQLRIYGFNALDDMARLAELRSLVSLQIIQTAPPGGPERLALVIPQLRELTLWGCHWLTDLEMLGDTSALVDLDVESSGLSSLAPLANAISLTELSLACPHVRDISALRGMPSLRRLYVRHLGRDVDFSILSDCPISITFFDHDLYRYWHQRMPTIVPKQLRPRYSKKRL